MCILTQQPMIHLYSPLDNRGLYCDWINWRDYVSPRDLANFEHQFAGMSPLTRLTDDARRSAYVPGCLGICLLVVDFRE